MNAAAEAMRYEEAAGHRDRIRMLQRVRSGQAVDTGAGAATPTSSSSVEREGVWCVTLAMVRGGRHLGDRSFFPQNASRQRRRRRCSRPSSTQHYAQQPVPATHRRATSCEAPAPRWRRCSAELARQPGADRLAARRRVARVARHGAQERRASRSTSALAAQAHAGGARRGAAGVPRRPRRRSARIECFDISHTMGEAAGGVVRRVRQGRDADAREYRRYNVKGVEPGDDYGAMRYALRGALPHARPTGRGQACPDLILIDGGKGQLNAAREVMADLGPAPRSR